MKMSLADFRPFAGVVVATALILMVPLVSMQFSDEVNWSGFDFAAMSVLLLVAGSTLVLIPKVVRTHRVAAGVAAVAVFLFIWVELAVGLVGSPLAGS